VAGAGELATRKGKEASGPSPVRMARLTDMGPGALLMSDGRDVAL